MLSFECHVYNMTTTKSFNSSTYLRNMMSSLTCCVRVMMISLFRKYGLHVYLSKTKT